MLIVKKDGSKEEFSQEKIKSACLRAGAPPDLADNIANEVAYQVHEGMTTEEIRILVLSKLRKVDHSCVQKWVEYEKNK